MSFTLPQTLAAWRTDTFANTFKKEMAGIDPAQLPLLKLLRYGSHIVDQPAFMILGSEADEKSLRIRTGIFFHSILGGCSCADDPTPIDTYNEYGELELSIDRHSAKTRAEPI